MAARGHDVQVVTRTYPAFEGARRPLEHLQIDYLQLPLVRKSPVFGRALLANYVARFRPDIVQTSSPSLADILMPSPRRLGVPYATLFHAQLGTSLPARAIQWLNVNRLKRDWAAIAVTSSFWKEWLVARGVPPDVLHVISSAVSARFAAGPLPNAQRRERSALFVGGLDDVQSYKRFDLLIAAAERLKQVYPEFSWQLTAAGDGNLRARYEADVARRGLQDTIRFAGRVGDETLHELYSTASLVVLPSSDLREGWGVVLAEALSCGAPVVLTDGMGGSREFGAAPGAVIVPRNDARALAAALREQLLRGPDGRDAERQIFARRFHADRVAAHYESMYAAAIAQRSAAS